MAASTTTDLLIVGAGPFGLAMAAHARHLGIDHLIVGEPMGFWHSHMPDGMYLRSACDWHLDPENDATIEAFLRTQGLSAKEVEPLSRARYLEYAGWFQAQKQIEPQQVVVERLDAIGTGNTPFRATLADDGAIEARGVVLAVGLASFAHVPEDLARVLPANGVEHTCDLVDFAAVRGERCLIVGGRQSAFEWAALMCEAGAAAVHVCHRHDSPAFAASDWAWVNAVVDGMVENPGWYRRLSQAEKDAVTGRLWSEGRLKLEPWLDARIRRAEIRVWPNTRVTASRECGSGGFTVTLDGGGGGRDLDVDRVVLATGYKADVRRVSLLARGNLLPRLQVDNGLPVLDEHLQSSVPGLFLTSALASRDFGPFFGFTLAVRTSAKLIGQALRA